MDKQTNDHFLPCSKGHATHAVHETIHLSVPLASYPAPDCGQARSHPSHWTGASLMTTAATTAAAATTTTITTTTTTTSTPRFQKKGSETA